MLLTLQEIKKLVAFRVYLFQFPILSSSCHINHINFWDDLSYSVWPTMVDEHSPTSRIPKLSPPVRRGRPSISSVGTPLSGASHNNDTAVGAENSSVSFKVIS